MSAIIDDGASSGRHTSGAQVVELKRSSKDWFGAADVVAVSSGSAALRGASEPMRDDTYVVTAFGGAAAVTTAVSDS